MSNDVPLRFPRLIALTLTQWLAVVVGGLQARALVILQDREQQTANSGLPGAVLHAGDIVAAGAVQIAAAGIAGFTALAAGIYLTFKPHKRVHRSVLALLAFSIVFVLAGDLASTLVATLSSARVTAAPSIPQAVIDGLVKASGQSLDYLDTWQVKAYVIVGWILWLFLVLATAMEFAADRKKSQVPASGANSSPSPQMTEASTDEKYSEDRVA